MHHRLEGLFQKIEAQRHSLTDSLIHLPPAQLHVHDEGKWSIHHIVAHLIAAERLSVGYLRKKVQGIEAAPDTGVKEALKMLLLQIAMRLPIKFKAPKVVEEHTRTEAELAELLQDWETVRAELKEILERIEPAHVRRKIYRHVRIGMIDSRQTVAFFYEHVRHHKQQIRRLMKQS